MIRDEGLDDFLRTAIEDRMESWDLVELLGIPIKDIIYNFEDEIIKSIDELKEYLRIDDPED